MTSTFSIQKPASWFSAYPVHGDLLAISYFIDQKKVDVADSGLDNNHYSSDPVAFDGFLSGLSEGNHSFRVWVRSVSYYLDPNRPTSGYGYWLYPPANYFFETNSTTVSFTVDTVPPSISILSIENKTYSAPKLPINLFLNEPTSKIMYCLDNTANTTMAESADLTGLSIGPHSLTIYAYDLAGNAGSSQTIYFTIAQSMEPTPEAPSSLLTVAILAVIISIITVGILVMLKKRRTTVRDI